ncbi:hypothetical protein ABID26_006340 [Mesorhizobium shonense]|uniref:Uncharacterized protein n=1 Tax=Mesorhizobium shonense TaxID=1209948 RepID=A0ABV2I211_9HYPH
MAIATSGYMAVVIDFSGLVAACRQADPRANRSGFPELSGSSTAVMKEVAVMAPMPEIDMRMRQA